MSKRRVVSLVDGFNLWHAIREIKRPELKWVCLRDLALQFVDKATEDLGDVFYFSAIAAWRDPAAVQRHQMYMRALRHRGVKVVLGRFKAKQDFCHKCKHTFTRHEEKETDVNIAASMTSNILGGAYDRCLLFSGDTDFAAVVDAITRLSGVKGVIRPVFPPNRFVGAALHKATGRKKPTKMLVQHLEASLMPDVVGHDAQGEIARPTKWTAPAIPTPTVPAAVP